MNVLKNQRGVTLIELLAVIVILGIIAAIAIPAVMSNFDSAKTNADAQTEAILKEATQRYLLDNPLDSPITATTISTADLQAGGYITDSPVLNSKKQTASISIEAVTGKITVVWN